MKRNLMPVLVQAQAWDTQLSSNNERVREELFGSFSTHFLGFFKIFKDFQVFVRDFQRFQRFSKKNLRF